jgi:predicted RNase H-like nuclease (RuvC/YqgF family)
MFPAEIVKVYEMLKPRLGDQETTVLLDFIEDRTVHIVKDEIAKGLATKADLAELGDRLVKASKADTAELRGELTADTAELRGELTADIAELRDELARIKDVMATKAGIAELRGELTEVKSAVTTLEKEMIKFRWRMYDSVEFRARGLGCFALERLDYVL